MRTFLILLSISFLFASCKSGGDGDTAKLKEELAMYKKSMEEHEANAKMLTDKLQEIDAWFMQIDDSHSDITQSISEGNLDAFNSKMQSVEDYISKSRAQIDALEKALKTSESKKSLYQGIVKKLKDDLAKKEAVITELNETVKRYQSENKELTDIVDIQETQIQEKSKEIAAKKVELQQMEDKLEKMKEAARDEQALSWYNQGINHVALAKKSKLAPKKKKLHYQTAYDLFKKAYAQGHVESKAAMDEIADKID